MFSVYMQEVNLNFFIIFNSFYLRFCFGPQVCVGNSSFRICGVVTLHGSVRNIFLLHTHVILPPHFTKNFHTRRFGCITVTTRDRPTFLECCSSLWTCVIISSIYFTRGNREYLYYVSLFRQGKGN